jgi:hypothetical protein
VSQDAGGNFTIHAGAVSPVATLPDEELLVSRPLPVAGSVTAQLTDRANLSFWGATGLQGVEVRQDATTNAPAYAFGMGGAGHLAVWWRPTAGAALQTKELPAVASLPTWLRITRNGTALVAQTSADGQSWQDAPGSSQTVALTGTALGGLTDWESTSPNVALPGVAGTARFAATSVASGDQATPTPVATATTSASATSSATTSSTATSSASATVTVTQTVTQTVTVTQTAAMSASFDLTCSNNAGVIACAGK